MLKVIQLKMASLKLNALVNLLVARNKTLVLSKRFKTVGLVEILPVSACFPLKII
jgi:hypothetical protein